ncbi:ras-like protein [Antechinus flavipes]|uniref:ras-like protein n=1 Tax=Antechinus flavipes TaxID=38775 RepID=UPI0022369DBC|nr:ras-like protein [Antechinus flavipes]
MLYKLVVMGSPGVGKSALTICFLQKRFVAECFPSDMGLYHSEVEVDGIPCELIILDTPGGEQHPDRWEDFIRWGEGFLCVYAVDYIKTFVDVNFFWDQLQKVKGTSRVPMVLVANKIDQTHWLVDSDLGQEAGRNLKVPFVETSAKTQQGVEQAFYELIREIRRMRGEEPQSCLRPLRWRQSFGLRNCSLL